VCSWSRQAFSEIDERAAANTVRPWSLEIAMERVGGTIEGEHMAGRTEIEHVAAPNAGDENK
jgi:hypothetical protein